MKKYCIKDRKLSGLLCLIIISLLSGCASPRPVIQSYLGKLLPEEKVAFVFPTVFIEIISLDSRSMTKYGDRYRSFEVTPGYHKIGVQYNYNNYRTLRIVTDDVQVIQFKAEAGRIYTIDSKVEKNKWGARIIDITNEEKGKRYKESIKLNENGKREVVVLM